MLSCHPIFLMARRMNGSTDTIEQTIEFLGGYGYYYYEAFTFLTGLACSFCIDICFFIKSLEQGLLVRSRPRVVLFSLLLSLLFIRSNFIILLFLFIEVVLLIIISEGDFPFSCSPGFLKAWRGLAGDLEAVLGRCTLFAESNTDWNLAPGLYSSVSSVSFFTSPASSFNSWFAYFSISFFSKSSFCTYSYSLSGEAID